MNHRISGSGVPGARQENEGVLVAASLEDKFAMRVEFGDGKPGVSFWHPDRETSSGSAVRLTERADVEAVRDLLTRWLDNSIDNRPNDGVIRNGAHA